MRLTSPTVGIVSVITSAARRYPQTVGRSSTIACAMVLILGSLGVASQAHALTMEVINGDSVVYDDENDRYWYWDLSAFTSLTYAQQASGIQQLNVDEYFGMTTWHIATEPEMQELFRFGTEEIRGTFNPSQERYDGSYEWHYWTGRYDDAGTRKAVQTAWGNFAFGPWDYAWPDLEGTRYDDSLALPRLGAWVVTPEPATLPLVIFGLGALSAAQRRRRGGFRTHRHTARHGKRLSGDCASRRAPGPAPQ